MRPQMRPLLFSIALLTAVAAVAPAPAQETISLADEVASVDIVTPVAAPAGDTHQDRVINAVRDAIKKDAKLGPIRKRIALLSLRRPLVQQQIADRITAASLDRGAIVVTGDEDEPFQADWSEIFEIIKEYLPILLQLLMLFG